MSKRKDESKSQPETKQKKTRFNKDYKTYVLGVDEVGRGSFSGPVTDSKKIVKSQKESAASKRKRLAEELCSHKGVVFSIVENSNTRIDEINILRATEECMDKAVRNVIQSVLEMEEKQPKAAALGAKPIKIHVLIDGNHLPSRLCELKQSINNVEEGRTPSKYIIELETVVKGDSKCYCIAAASIIAKNHRDTKMDDLHLLHPEYEWDQNKGYGTKKHIEAIKAHGKTDLHRQSFNIKSIDENSEQNK